MSTVGSVRFSVVAGLIFLSGTAAWIGRDLAAAASRCRALYAVDTAGSQVLGDLQYGAQESRRAFLYALAIHDPNEQLPYIDHAREAGVNVARLRAQLAALTPDGNLRRELSLFQQHWSRYEAARDEIIARILEGDARAALRVDQTLGEQTFNQSIAALMQVKTSVQAGALYRSELVNRTLRRCAAELGVFGTALVTILVALLHAHRERNRAATALQQNNQELALARQLEQGKAAILELVSTRAPLQDILEAIVGMVTQFAPHCGAALWVVQDATLQLRATANLPATDTSTWASQTIPISQDKTSTLAALALAAHTAGRVGLDVARVWPLCDAAEGLNGVMQIYRLPTAMETPVGVLEQIASLARVSLENRALYERLAFQAQHDALTALPNRLLFHDRLQEAIRAAPTSSSKVVVLWLDLDRYKQINDTLGHRAGDELLCAVARRLTACLRPGDMVARVGGDEFTVVLQNIRSGAEAVAIADKMLQAINAPLLLAGQDILVTASCGICLYPDHGTEPTVLLCNADLAMYQAKKKGRNAHHLFEAALSTGVARQLAIEHHLKQALERQEFFLEYQPLMDRQGRIQKLEALLRWESATLGRVPPMDFIPIAEEMGLIISIGEWVVRKACAEGLWWHQAGYAIPRICVNVSPLQLAQKNFAVSISRVLTELQYPPEALELEVTETALVNNLEHVVEQINLLRALGVSFAIDDFGTGYSSLSQLRNLPVDSIKIDRSFVRDLAEGENSSALLVRGIVDLAHSLGLQVVAEGIETEHQLANIHRMGCDVGQGYLLGRPTLARKLLAERQKADHPEKQVPAVADKTLSRADGASCLASADAPALVQALGQQ